MVDAMQTVLTRHWHQTCGSVQEVSATCLMLGLELQFWHSPWQPDKSTKLQKQQCVKLCSAVSSYVVLHSCPQCTIIIEQIRIQLGHKTRIPRRQIFEQCVLWETNKFKSSSTRSWRCTWRMWFQIIFRKEKRKHGNWLLCNNKIAEGDCQR